MKKIAYIFPGQGAQYVGMGKDLFEKSKASQQVFEKADKLLGIGLSKICFQGPAEQLKRTDICQPSILATSIACLEALKEQAGDNLNKILPSYCAGLSLGEYSALVASRVLSLEDALKIVRKRGQFMEEAAKINRGAMMSVIGLDEQKVRQICAKHSCFVTNLNCPGQVVISGLAKNLQGIEQDASAQGALRVIPLEVSGAFHTPLMQEASIKLAEELEHYSFNKPEVNVVFNVSANIESSTDKIKNNLVKQVASSVLWEESIRLMLKSGISTFVEIGPGKVLKGLLRRIDPSSMVYNVETFDSVNALLKEDFVCG
jgi:[acyl-carrier-protein] S-malonyltransferase